MKLPTPAKIGMVSLGCPRNLVDSEGVLGRLAQQGHEIVDIDQAEVALVNTCAFIDDSRRESVDVILDLIDLKKRGKLKKIIVYGCLAQRYKAELAKELPEIDAFVGTPSLNHETGRFTLTPRHYAYLKICESCINQCSYCIIPKIKGRFRSLAPEFIWQKLRGFNTAGISELNIIGQDITGYGRDLKGAMDLTGLLRKISRRAASIHWLRLLYLYPSRISDELIELIRQDERICKYIDLPLQHVNGRILTLMNRRTTKAGILKLIEKIRRRIPGVALRTSFIVGFPSETDKEFAELMQSIRAIQFERLGAFIYSQEEGTPAARLSHQVPEKVQRQRFNQLMQAQQEVSCVVNRRFLGKTIEVLLEERQQDGVWLGRSQFDAPEVDGLVYVHSPGAHTPGEFVQVTVTDTLEYDLVGKAVVDEPRQ